MIIISKIKQKFCNHDWESEINQELAKRLCPVATTTSIDEIVLNKIIIEEYIKITGSCIYQGSSRDVAEWKISKITEKYSVCNKCGKKRRIDRKEEDLKSWNDA
ncbi:MAG: hypothetical protein GF353_22530 [Candidatus Lokiarchaeota archaeon]|nr:hypothetical protein [Candidatus Lokiarchaeota archaeon]